MSLLINIYRKSPNFIKNCWRKIFKSSWEERKILSALKKVSPEGIRYNENFIKEYVDRKKYYSQFGQDIFLDKIVFQGKREGFFIDIGANHPKNLSNTLFFEELGWKGIAFEPQSRLCELWKERKTKCYNYALGDKECEIEFAEIEGDSDPDGTLAGVASVLEGGG